MPEKQPPPARGFVDCGEDLNNYRTEQWLAELARKQWVYLQRLESAALGSDDDNAWTKHELFQVRCRLRTIDWLRTLNIQRRG